MAPRLTGNPLRLVRHLVRQRPFAAALFAASAKDFGLDKLRALPASGRFPLDDLELPVAGRAPHTWAHADLPVATPTRASASALHQAYRRRASTPRQVLEAVHGRIAAGRFGESVYSPFVTLDDRASEAAVAATARFAAGIPRSPLDGVPVAVKDEVDMVGLPTLGGTRYRTTPATRDGWFVKRLQDAGAVIVGKTHATEWGMNPCGFNPHHAFPRNVYSREHGAGGSSTGSAVAVGLGLVPVAVGSDGGCSIRTPACLAGVFGLKPSYARVGRTGDVWQDGSSMSHLGPIGGTVTDLVDLLSVLAGRDPDDPATFYAPDGHDAAPWRHALGRGVRGCRIGVVRSEWAAASPAVARAGLAALDALAADGAVLVDVELPLADVAPAVGALVIASEAAANQADDEATHGDDYGDELAIVFALMRQLSAQELLAAYRTRAALRRQVAAVFAGDIDVLALPTIPGPAPRYPLSEDGVHVFSPADTAAMTRFAFLGNLTGLPAGTVPLGHHHGLPMGLQLVGDAWDEASVLAVMAHAERQAWCRWERPSGFEDLLAVGMR